MQVVNRKERSNAKWRFAGLYLLSLAIPALLIFNSIDMGKVENKDTGQLVDQLRKRDLALAELSQLATTLNRMQQLKPAFESYPEAVNKEEYEQLRFKFKTGVEKLRELYYKDTTLYRSNYSLVFFLDNNQKEYDRIAEEFNNKVNEGVATRTPGNTEKPFRPRGNGSEVDHIKCDQNLTKAEGKIEQLTVDLTSSTSELQRFRDRARAIEANVNQIADGLIFMEADCNGIEKKSDKNITIKNKILDRIKFLKGHISGLINPNSDLMDMVKEN